MRRAALAVAAVAALLAACSDDDPFRALPKPDPVDAESTTTLPEPDLSGIPLASVEGTTTTSVVLGPGPLTIVGRVEGPDGPVAGAIVELERVVGDGVASTRVPTAPDGTWNLAGVLGGRYRVRAWRAPDLATAQPELVFLESGPERAVSLRLEPVGGVRVDAAIAPDPPIIDEPANLKVRVAERSVDRDGVIRDLPRPGVEVQLAGSGDWSVRGSASDVTDGEGSVTFEIECEDDGEQPLVAVLDGAERYPLALPACFDPDAPTTTTTAPDDGSSTTTTTTTTEG